jgi:RES domain-containing protein
VATRRIIRVTHRNYAEDAYSGRGGLYAAGRWHHRGRLVAYAAASLALATLEKIVAVNHVQRLREIVYVPAHLDDEAVWAPSLEDLPDGWDQCPPGTASRDVGTDWLDSERSPALQVPSALFPTEAHNYVLNPAHPEFEAAVQVDEPQSLDLDPRIETRLGEKSP